MTDNRLPDSGAPSGKSHFAVSDQNEWLETDGLGGFASGTTSGIRTRRYHALLLTATTPPSGRVVLVNGIDAWVKAGGQSYPITTQRYGKTIVYPDGFSRLREFRIDPWPTWLFELAAGQFIERQLFVIYGRAAVFSTWRLLGEAAPETILSVRPFLSGRDFHSLHRENSAFKFDASVQGEEVVWQPYGQLPAIFARSNGTYRQAPDWFRNFFYLEESNRGLNAVEDLGSPGIFEWDLNKGPAVLAFAASSDSIGGRDTPCTTLITDAGKIEVSRRRRSHSRLDSAIDSYLVKRGDGKTVIAGYPWFGNWARDTFVALRGLALSTGRFEVARDILIEWSHAVSEGMLPNRFPDHDETPEFNAVDASLWYIVAVDEFLRTAGAEWTSPEVANKLASAIEAILTGYAAGTRFGIHADEDGLIAAGVKGTQLTWMDAKVNGYVVTPRFGKPVEIQALWLNALAIGSRFSKTWQPLFEKAKNSFETRFWNEKAGYLYDVIDVNHQPGRLDLAFRPNQLFAVGGLPLVLLSPGRARRMIDAVEAKLWTPMGLRSLARDEPGYSPHYEGDQGRRDTSYHQGTVWPWLIGPFVEAWVRVRGNSAEAKSEARAKFLAPLLEHLDVAGIGHVSEIADAEAPFTPRGCPFQAWSLGELLRLDRVVL